MKVHSKKIGQYNIEVKGESVAIVGNYGSNFGHFYSHAFERFKKHPQGEPFDWNRPQILGMEWEYGLTSRVKDWLYSLVKNDKVETKQTNQ